MFDSYHLIGTICLCSPKRLRAISEPIGSKFDLAGRILQGVPAQINLVVPPHSYVTEMGILIGWDKETAFRYDVS
jgi:hypothetical protein